MNILTLIILIIIIFMILYIYYKFNDKEIKIGFGNRKEQFLSLKNYDDINTNIITPWAIDNTLKDHIINILNEIIDKINNEINMNYKVLSIENIQISNKINDNEYEYIIDLFIHETKLFYTRKLIIIIILNNCAKTVTVNYINISNGFKYPMNGLIGNIPELVLEDNLLLSKNHYIIGLNKSKLDFTPLKNNELITNKPLQNDFQKWIFPFGFQNNNDCYPSFNPTIIKNNNHNNLSWLFHLSDNYSGTSRHIAH